MCLSQLQRQSLEWEPQSEATPRKQQAFCHCWVGGPTSAATCPEVLTLSLQVLQLRDRVL